MSAGQMCDFQGAMVRNEADATFTSFHLELPYALAALPPPSLFPVLSA